VLLQGAFIETQTATAGTNALVLLAESATMRRRAATIVECVGWACVGADQAGLDDAASG